MPYIDPEKVKAKNRAYYHRNREARLEYARRYYSDPEKRERALERTRRWHEENKDRRAERDRQRKIQRLRDLAALKDSPCEDCGVKYPPMAMDFHHPDNDGNRFNFTHRKWDDVLEEVKKCVLLCANCHRMRHDCYVDL